MRVALRLAYDGTGLAGWQRQPGRDTVQGRLEDALAALGIGAPVTCASRTDAGVHAEGQVAHLALPGLDPALAGALAARLAPGIRLLGLARAPPRFHARWSSRGKVYRYLFAIPADLAAAAADRFLRERAWVLPDPRGFPEDPGASWGGRFDVKAMGRALGSLLGTRDFRGLATSRGALAPGEGTRRLGAGRIQVAPYPGAAAGVLVGVTVSGTAFLRHQVRCLAGLLAQVGAGEVAAEAARDLVAARDRHHGPRGPGRGLTLVRVRYPVPVDPFPGPGRGGISRRGPGGPGASPRRTRGR